jgi:diguanylate cyclase (GGDEF)-like protein
MSFFRRAPTPHPELASLRAVRRDPLTGLASRAAFLEALAKRLAERKPAALLLADIDRFGALNTTHGHRVADEVLLALANRLRLMSPDVGRLGGDQLAALVPKGEGDWLEAAALAGMRGLLAPVTCAAGTLDCSVSLGIVRLPGHAADVDGALRAAGTALAQVKAAGGGGWRIFDPEAEAARLQREALARELRGAIEANAIVPHYQPIVRLADRGVVGLEVLARWQHPTRGIVPPDLFIPMAEDLHLTGQITEQLMRRVIGDARAWAPHLYFAFNVSPGQLRELIRMVRSPPTWPEGALDPARLEIEVTESALIEDLEVAREVIGLLQGRGTRVVLDDFGIGFSNFFHLRELPFDRIKIDRSFVMDIATDPRAEACVRAMLALGASLGVPMVAEGIENAGTEATVARLGCVFGQGYFYSAPVAGPEVGALLRRLGGRVAA